MEKEQYNIDDILAEVKKHKESQEKKDNPVSESAQEPAKENAEKAEESPKDMQEEKEESQRVQEPQQAENSSFKINEQFDEPEKEEKLNIVEEQDSISEEKEETYADTEAGADDTADFEDDLTQDSKEQEISENEEPALLPEQQEEEKEEMVDIMKVSADISPEYKKKEKVKFFKTKKGKVIKNIILSVLIVFVVACIVGVVILGRMLDNVAEDDQADVTYDAVTYYEGMDFLQEDFPLISEPSAYEIYGYKDYLKNWYENGDPVRSSHVLNVLLIGEDTREEEISDASRADSAIIASINVDTGVIHMTSILRDLYVYYEVDGEGYYGKINESASYGGLNCYITTVERNYKIAIDGYAVVNFASFPKIIDALGGVDINITDAEINEINNNPSVYDDVGEVYIEKTFEGEEGVMTLDGLQALAYCRIRHIDGDDVRANRQKTVLTEILDKMRASSTLDAVKAVNQLSKYTKTSYSKSELISIGNLALRDNWLNYTISSNNVPAEENRKGGQYFSVSYNNWIWLADLPKDAYELQNTIYGKSNIQLNENRPDYISMGL